MPCKYPLKSKLSSLHHSASLQLQLHEVNQSDKERSWMCVALNKGHNICFVPKGHNNKCIIMGRIPLFHHEVIGRFSWPARAITTHFHLHIISKSPLFHICSSHPAPSCSTMAMPTACNNHFCWVAIYVILPCIMYPHFLACLLFLDCTDQGCCTFGMMWAYSGKLGCIWVT